MHGDRQRTLTLADLAALPQRTESLPIACVEGWSAGGDWTGVRLRDLLDLVGAPPGATSTSSRCSSAAPTGARRCRRTSRTTARTLLALRLAGETLAIDHGYPARLIAPDRPGVLQTKWVHRIEVLA